MLAFSAARRVSGFNPGSILGQAFTAPCVSVDFLQVLHKTWRQVWKWSRILTLDEEMFIVSLFDVCCRSQLVFVRSGLKVNNGALISHSEIRSQWKLKWETCYFPRLEVSSKFHTLKLPPFSFDQQSSSQLCRPAELSVVWRQWGSRELVCLPVESGTDDMCSVSLSDLGSFVHRWALSSAQRGRAAVKS